MKKNPHAIIINASSRQADGEATYIPLLSDSTSDSDISLNDGDVLPLLPLRGIVLFPGVVFPVPIGRKKSLRLVREAYRKKTLIGAVTQRDKEMEEPSVADLYTIGTVARIIRILEMPDNTTTVILQGCQRFSVGEVVENNLYLSAHISLINNNNICRRKGFKVMLDAIKDIANRIIRLSNIPQELAFAIRNIENPSYFVNFVSANINLAIEDKQSLLCENELYSQAELLLHLLTVEEQRLEMKADIHNKAVETIDKQQREYFLQEQMKTIQNELGGSAQEQDIKEFRKKAETKKWNEQVAQAVNREIDRLQALSPHAADYSMQMNYVSTLVNLPWGEYSKDNLNLSRARRVLDNDHFGLDEIKERLIEHLAVIKLRGGLKSPILCLYGPPGVGKTSLGKSIAEALGRKYARISLGGLNDEAELRGHRRTYIGAMPGRIIQNLLKVGTSNPVFVLDEIDKVGSDYKGDPAAALLEILDPEQNSAFHDNYIDMDYDLSNVLFIATANDIQSVSKPLRDRMELINVSGYIVEEKLEIAKRHLIPKTWENHGISTKNITLSKDAIEYIINRYTMESGVRALEKQLSKLARKMACKTADNANFSLHLTAKDIPAYLGMELSDHEKQEDKEEIGIVTGLAWTSVGGEILQIESSLSEGKTPSLTLTGNLGDVMKESATLGVAYLRAHAATYAIDPTRFDSTQIHIHVPEGAVPKDGPSAGITIATSLLSAFTNRKVRRHLAMTGEITLHGKVLPVGGIKEKILAAKRAGVTDIILCAENQRNIEDIKEVYRKGLHFHYVRTVDEVFDIALL